MSNIKLLQAFLVEAEGCRKGESLVVVSQKDSACTKLDMSRVENLLEVMWHVDN